jgi:hypothetical protein
MARRGSWNLGKPGRGSKLTRIGMLERRKPDRLRPTAELLELTAERYAGACFSALRLPRVFCMTS